MADTTRVLLIGFEDDPALAGRLTTGLSAAWTGRAALAFEHSPLNAAVAAGEFPACEACLLITSEKNFGAPLYRLLDRLYERRIPTIALAPDLRFGRAHLSEAEAVVGPLDEPPDRLAARLDALIQRQATVDRLSTELRIARRCQWGLQGEVTRMHDEMQMAAMIQREFLPRELPQIGDVHFGVFFRPAGYVSGDIYDIRRLDEHTVGFFLADAVGHGVPAALLTMVITRCLRPKIIEGHSYRILPPGEVLTNLNEELVRHQQHGGRFATAIYGTLDVRTREVRVASAGHPPPLRICENNERRAVAVEGCLLGVFENAAFEEQSFTLGTDERLVIYSDGFETAFPPKQADHHARRMPSDRYVGFFRDLCGPQTSVEQSVAHLAALIDDQCGSLHQIDDLTVIVIAAGVSAVESQREDAVEPIRAAA